MVTIHPHDPGAVTEGLVFLDGALLESTGLNGQSSLRKVELKTGRVLKHVEVPEQYFAEGLAVLADKVFQLTWQDHKGFVYDLESLRLKREFPYEGKGWGLTTDLAPPVIRVSQTPFLYALRMLNPFKIAGIFGKPPLLALGLAHLLALGQVTKLLPLAVPVIRDKKDVAVQTPPIFDKRHDLLPPGQSSGVSGNTGIKWFEEGRNRKKNFRN